MPGICDGGTCMNTDGGVICDCPEGFVLSSNGMKCIDTRQDHCYDKFLSGQYNILVQWFTSSRFQSSGGCPIYIIWYLNHEFKIVCFGK